MTALYDKLKKYNSVRMHMPGHKGNPLAAPYMNTDASFDITEINGFDNLHDAQGILKESMEKAAELWHSKKSFYLVNGSTCGILAGIGASVRRGDKIICARGCHMSVFHAVELFGLRPVFFAPPQLPCCGAFASANVAEIDKLIEKNPDASLIVLTSPTYEGVISDIESICSAAHRRGIKVLADEAHGAHLDLSPHFTGGAVRAQADITVQSLHKTLPCPTQTAILHINSERIDIERLKHMLSVFETSSPSYLFLSAADGFVRSFDMHKMECWSAAIDTFYKQLHTEKLLLPPILFDNPLVYKHDKSKIPISTQNADIDGDGLAQLLRGKYNIETEMSCRTHCLAMTGYGDTEKSLSALAGALNEIDSNLHYEKKADSSLHYTIPRLEMLPCDALMHESEFISTAQCGGEICGEYVWAYPPGIPLLIPGERISPEIASDISGNPQFCSTYGVSAEKIAVVR